MFGRSKSGGAPTATSMFVTIPKCAISCRAILSKSITNERASSEASGGSVVDVRSIEIAA